MNLSFEHIKEPGFVLAHGLQRGRAMRAAATIEHNGIPIDLVSKEILEKFWETIKVRLVAKYDPKGEVFEGTSFRQDKFVIWLKKRSIPWPQLDSGRLALDDNTFKMMAQSYPEVAAIRDLRYALSKMRLSDLAVGPDARNRCLLSAFQAKTGRFQPSNAKFAFGPAVWIRGLIQAPKGYGIAYVDYCQQEFGIAAALSGDAAMQEAYLSGDPYMVFAIQAGSAPPGATKKTHKQVRDLFKACVLAVQYGMSALSLSKRINQSVADARWLLDLHHHTYRVFWKWSDAASDFARLHGYLYTVFGWLLHLSGEINGRSLRTEEMATIDLKQFTLDTACVPRGRATQVGRPSRHARGVYFLKGPVPWSWLQKAMSLPGRALHVSLYLWWQAGMNKKHEVSVSLSRITRETGVPRLTLVRGLKTLEQAGLVSVLRHSGRKPQVTILDTDSRDE